MKRSIKSFIARWIANRIETRNRRIRRLLRDHQRVVLARVRSADHRALGLKLYAAWSTPKEKPEIRRSELLWVPSPVRQSVPDLRIQQLVDYNA